MEEDFLDATKEDIKKLVTKLNNSEYSEKIKVSLRERQKFQERKMREFFT